MKGFQSAINSAKHIYKNREKIKALYKKSGSKTEEHADEVGDSMLNDLRTLRDLLQSWLKGQYKLSTRTIVYVIAGLLYFVNPLDLVPDFIVGLGFVDDAAILTLVLRSIRSEVSRYKKAMEFQEVEVVS
ncbi:MAG: DUF1232 domain-containing protein [Bacteroidia bacterium]